MGDTDGTLKTSHPSNISSSVYTANSKPTLKHDINSIIDSEKKSFGTKRATNIIPEQPTKPTNGLITLYPLTNQAVTFSQPTILHPLQSFTSQIFDDSFIPAVGAVVPQTVVQQGAIIPQGSIVPQGTFVQQSNVVPQSAIVQSGTVIPQGAIVQQGAIIPQGTIIPQGSIIPQGTIVSQGAIVPQGTIVPQNTITSQGTIVAQRAVLPQRTVVRQTAAVPQGTMLSNTNLVPVPVSMTNPVHMLSAPSNEKTNPPGTSYPPDGAIVKLEPVEPFSPPPIKIINVKGKLFECANCPFKTRHLRHFLFHPKRCGNYFDKAKNLSADTDSKGGKNSPHVFQGNKPFHRTNRVQTVPPQILFKGVNFQCDLCPSKFSSERSLKGHVKNKHKPLYTCNYCNFKAVEKNKIQQHLEKDCKLLPPKCFTCMVCNQVLRTMGEVEKHFTERHPQFTTGQYTVKQGYLSFGNTKNAISQVFQNHNPDPKLGPLLSCVSCPYKTISLQDLENHISSHNKELISTSVFSKSNVRQNKKKPAHTEANSGDNRMLQQFPLNTTKGMPVSAPQQFPLNPPKVSKRKVETIPGMEALARPKKEKNVICDHCPFRTNSKFNLRRHIKCRHKEIFEKLYGNTKQTCKKLETSAFQKAEKNITDFKIGSQPLPVNTSKEQAPPAISQSYIPLQPYQALQTLQTINTQPTQQTVSLLGGNSGVPLGTIVSPKVHLLCGEQDQAAVNLIQKAQIQTCQGSHPLLNAPSYLYYTPPLQPLSGQHSLQPKQEPLCTADSKTLGNGKAVAESQLGLVSGDSLKGLAESNKLHRVNNWVP